MEMMTILKDGPNSTGVTVTLALELTLAIGAAQYCKLTSVLH